MSIGTTPLKTPQDTGETDPAPRRSLFLVPLLGFLVIAVAFGIGLGLNPKEIPSALIGKEVPAFELPPVQGRTLGLSDKNLIGEVSLVNVFASWCLECRVEHGLLMDLGENGPVPIHGLNYKDKPQDAADWLDKMGDPYQRTGADIKGRVSIDWGVYGVPETFLVDQQGRIVYKHIGVLSRQIFEQKILPLIVDLKAQGS